MRSHAKASTAGSTRHQIGRRALPMGFLAALLALLILAIPAGAKTHLFKETFGSAAQPSFTSPQGIAIDQSSGDVLVMDAGSPPSIKRFNPDGTPANFSGLGTNVIDGEGTGNCATIPADCDQTPQNGLSFASASESQIAVDNSGGATDGNVYVTQGSPNLINVFSEEGEYLGQLSESSGGPFFEACGVAVDPAGAVYVGDFGGGIHKFVPAANPPVNADYTATFSSVSEPCTLAAGAGASAGFLFPASWNGPISKIDSASGELKYAVSSDSNTTVSVNPASGNVYAAAGSTIKELDASGAGSASPVSSTSLASGANGLAVRGSSGDIYVSRAGNSGLEVFSGVLSAVPPTLAASWSQDVVYTEATIKAEINPQGSPTTFHVKYGTSASYGQQTPELSVGSDEAIHTVSALLEGLTPGTTYHYRVLVTNAAATIEGPDQTFTTFAPFAPQTDCANQAFRGGPAANLPDCRAYEMVTPIEKGGGDIYEGVIGIGGFDMGSEQAALDGEKMTYTAERPFGDAVSNLEPGTQYIASRGPGGWSSHAITPPHENNRQLFSGGFSGLPGRFLAFTEDLSTGFLYDDAKPPLTPDAIADTNNYYLRDNVSETYEAITTQFLSGSPNLGGGHSHLLGYSGDGSHVLVDAWAQLTPDAHPVGEPQVYDYHDGELELVSILPGGEPAARADAGAGQGTAEASETAHVISADGSRIFWTSYEGFSANSGKIYVRIDGETTIPVSESVAGGAEATYWNASADGSTVVFSAGQGAGQDLYRFDVDSETPTLIAGGVNSEHGVLGVSEDASRVYFLSKEALAAGATAGQPNLYLDQEGDKTFIATLAERDEIGPGATANNGRSGAIGSESLFSDFSQVTPDGGHVVFNSRAPLSGYDNTSLDTGTPAVEVYRYAADSDQLTCISCNPSGARPETGFLPLPHWLHEREFLDVQAAAWLPTPRRGSYTPRMVRDDGNRVFFNALDALVPQDTNGVQDVYQWEAQGIGSCTKPGGCVRLISTGTSAGKSTFIDASEGGVDVFFRTGASIDPDDPGLKDIYDARAGGGFARPSAPPPCLGDACQSVPAPPSDPTPASAGFRGAGNPLPGKPRRRCRARNRKAKQSGKAKTKKAKRCRRNHRRAGR